MPRTPTPLVTAAAVAVTAVPSLLQFVLPALEPALRRDPAAVAGGQWWRLLTSLVTQDGGIAGTAFNLVTLAVVGCLAERALGPWRWLALYGAGAVCGQVAGMLWGTVGAGNSIAVCGLAGGLAIAALRERAGATRTENTRPESTRAGSPEAGTPPAGTSRTGASRAGALAGSVAAFYALILTAAGLLGGSTAGTVALVVLCAAGAQLVVHRERMPRWVFPAVVTAGGALLAAFSDLHGPALLGGLVCGLAVAGRPAAPAREV
ncbi:rhomboid family intramembrane serine protease [Streptosporangium sp. NPDC004379]|uniref:rhomboid family intramembrane serine protease n=1 Tax=Streptosporangium sp. NPDC004379 TaxID=3366189 RepID=UPI0036BC2160